jgi:hypothetical protein
VTAHASDVLLRELLPDSRAKRATGGIRGPRGTWIPIYCANCGDEGGLVPEENMTFAFYLCSACEHHGIQAHFYAEPDTVFWHRVRQEQIDKHARLLSPEELLAELGRRDSPLAKLFKDRLAKGPL